MCHAVAGAKLRGALGGESASREARCTAAPKRARPERLAPLRIRGKRIVHDARAGAVAAGGDGMPGEDNQSRPQVRGFAAAMTRTSRPSHGHGHGARCLAARRWIIKVGHRQVWDSGSAKLSHLDLETERAD